MWSGTWMCLPDSSRCLPRTRTTEGVTVRTSKKVSRSPVHHSVHRAVGPWASPFGSVSHGRQTGTRTDSITSIYVCFVFLGFLPQTRKRAGWSVLFTCFNHRRQLQTDATRTWGKNNKISLSGSCSNEPERRDRRAPEGPSDGLTHRVEN